MNIASFECRKLAAWLVAGVVSAVSTAHAAPGDLDPGFGTGGKVITSFASRGPDDAVAIARDGAGNIYVGGSGYSSLGGGSQDFAVAKLDQSGQLATSFGNGGRLLFNVSTYGDRGRALAIAGAHGYLAGSADVGNGVAFVVGKFDLNGQLAASFGTGGIRIVSFGETAISYAEAVAVDATGNVFVAGASRTAPGLADALAIVKLDATGAPVAGFGSGGIVTLPMTGFTGSVYAIALDGSGGVYLAATRRTPDYTASSVVVYRLGADGLVDAGFGNAGSTVVTFTSNFDEVYGLVRAGNGDLYLAGTILPFGTFNRKVGVAKLGANGVLSGSYGAGGKAVFGISGHSLEGRSMALDADGNAYVAGVDEESVSGFLVVRFDSAGQVAAGFGNGGSTTIDFSQEYDFGFATLLDGSGRLYVAGAVNGMGGSTRLIGIARLLVTPADVIFRSGFDP